jgi:hypothetical protein
LPPPPPSPKNFLFFKLHFVVFGGGGGGGGVELYCRPYYAGVLHSVSDQVQNLQNCFSTPNKNDQLRLHLGIGVFKVSLSMLEAHPKGCTVQIAPHVNKELKGQCHKIFCFWFFHESVSPQPQNIPLTPFKFFRKFTEIFASQGAPPVSRYQQHQWQICQRCQ